MKIYSTKIYSVAIKNQAALSKFKAATLYFKNPSAWILLDSEGGLIGGNNHDFYDYYCDSLEDCMEENIAWDIQDEIDSYLKNPQDSWIMESANILSRFSENDYFSRFIIDEWKCTFIDYYF